MFQNVIARVLIGCALAAVAVAASAQSWKPDRPVEFISGSAAGNSVDRMLRSRGVRPERPKRPVRPVARGFAR